MGRFWKGEDCSRMSSRATLEGNNPFRKESRGPDHPQGWEPPIPGERGGHGTEHRAHIFGDTSLFSSFLTGSRNQPQHLELGPWDL